LSPNVVGNIFILVRNLDIWEKYATIVHTVSVLAVINSDNLVGVQVSPIEYGHVLLIPCVLDCTPQRIDPDTFLLALQMAVEADNPYFRLGYNSLGAFATINHLHFQVQ
jgi:GDP-L-galactose phosphorylase